MAKLIARNVKLFGGGRDLSGRTNTGAMSFSAEAPDVTTFGLNTRERLQEGIRDFELSVGGWMDLSACQVDELFYDLIGASARWGYYPGDATASLPGKEIVGICSDYSSDGAVEGAATYSATISGCGTLWDVTSLKYGDVSAVGASNLGSVDFTSAEAHTVWYTFRLLTLTGTNPEITACMQDSADDSTFVTRVLFTAASAADQVITGSYASSARYRRARVETKGTSPCATFQISSGSMRE